MKKLTSIFMAVAMVLALAAPAMASSTIVGSTVSGGTVEPTNPYSSEFVGEYQETIIDIELPNNVALVFNPYRLEYSAAGHTTESGDNLVLVDKLADQIFSAPVTIVSKSNIQLDVNMGFTVAAGNGSEMTFAPSVADYEAITDPGQNVLLQMEYGIVANANADPSTSSDKKTITLSEDTTLTDLQALEDAKQASDPTKQANLTVTIPAGGSSNAKYFGYKFTGKASTVTSAAGDDPNPYNSQDTIDVGIVFTFLPVANPENQVQGGNFFYTLTAGSGGAANTVSVRTSTPAAANDSADITITLPKAINAKAGTGTRTYTLPGDLKYDVSGTATDGVTVADDGKTMTLKKELVVTKADVTKAADAKYVVTIPVEFTVTDGGTGTAEKTDTINYVVRVIMNPLAPAA